MLEIVQVSKKYRVREKGLLRPKYKVIEALQNVSLSVNKAETLAILGPNGAGKSTLCRIAAGMIKPTSGHALLNGVDITQNIRQVSKQIGVVFSQSLLYHRLTGYKYLRFFAKTYDVRNYDVRIKELAKTLDLEEWLDEHIESYSMGMKIKISLARALLHEPELLILDEFTMGLDPRMANHVRLLIKNLGVSTLVTTHNTLEAELMANRVALISKGSIVVMDELHSLLRRVSQTNKIVFRLKNRETPIASLNLAGQMEERDGYVQILVAEDMMPETLRSLSRSELDYIETKKPSLEDAYLYYTGLALREQTAILS